MDDQLVECVVTIGREEEGETINIGNVNTPTHLHYTN